MTDKNKLYLFLLLLGVALTLMDPPGTLTQLVSVLLFTAGLIGLIVSTLPDP